MYMRATMKLLVAILFVHFDETGVTIQRYIYPVRNQFSCS